MHSCILISSLEFAYEQFSTDATYSLKQKLMYSYNNQRTNGPVNAHLRPEIYTCTNKLVRLEWYNACI